MPFRAVLLPFLLLLSAPALAQTPSREQIYQGMMSTIKNIRTLRFHLYKSERIKGEMKAGEQDVKLNQTPFKVYLKVKSPNAGAEVLYLEGTNSNNALVYPGSFPYVNLNLDPDGSILRKDQHHSVKELGFKYTGEVIGTLHDRFKDKMNEYFQVLGEVEYKGVKCYKVFIDNKQYAYENYTVKAGENLLTIARRLKVNEYMLLEQNKLGSFTSVKAGQVIKVPNSYCKTIEAYIDKQTFLPIYQKMSDEHGLVAIYEYSGLKVNPTIAPEEFTEDFKDYKF
jgi:outer membrane lipoprotein-sorting protein